VHPTCYCYWLANSFSQFLLLDACASVDVLNLSYYCIIVLHCMLHLIPTVSNEYWYFHSPHLPLCSWLSSCIINLSCIIVLHCIIVLYCVFAYSPSVFSEYRFHHSPHPHVCLCVFFLQEGRFTLYYTLLFAYWHWHWPFLMVICLLPQLLRAVAPALTLITFF